MPYCMYLRKSRADAEAEARGEGETLARHRDALLRYAARAGLDVTGVYQEIVSGDTIAARPEMQRLLNDVQDGRWTGVLVMEIERLARGDTIDQGIVAQTFRYSRTLIITPQKTYDPANEFDEEYFEFGLFMSRREFATIKRRLLAGRTASARDGRYMGSRPVYGYSRKKVERDKGCTLEINPAEAEIVRQVFRWYADSDQGSGAIAARLNAMGLRTNMGNKFEPSYIRHMLQNDVYIGNVRWNQRTTVVTMQDGRRVSSRPPCDHPIVVRGLHEPIIDRDLFDRVQAMFAAHEKRPKNAQATMANPFSGLVVCALCGRHLQRKNGYRGAPDLLHCYTPGCPTSGISIERLEEIVLDRLRGWVTTYALYAGPAPEDDAARAARDQLIAQFRAQLATLDKQLAALHDLLERGVYDVDTFVARRADLTARAAAVRDAIAEAEAPAVTDADRIRAALPAVASVLDAYPAADSAARNRLLRSVFDHITYHKTHRCTRAEDPADFLTLDLYPVIFPNSDSMG